MPFVSNSPLRGHEWWSNAQGLPCGGDVLALNWSAHNFWQWDKCLLNTEGGWGHFFNNAINYCYFLTLLFLFLKRNVTNNQWSRLRDIHFLNLGRIVTWCSQWRMIHFMSIDRSWVYTLQCSKQCSAQSLRKEQPQKFHYQERRQMRFWIFWRCSTWKKQRVLLVSKK